MRSVTINYGTQSDLPVIAIVLASHPIDFPHERKDEYPGFTVTTKTMLHPDNVLQCIAQLVEHLDITDYPNSLTKEFAKQNITQSLLSIYTGEYQLRQAILESGFLKLEFTEPNNHTAIKAQIHFCQMSFDDVIDINLTTHNEEASITICAEDVIVTHKNQFSQKHYTLTGSKRYTDQVWYLRTSCDIS